MSRQRYKAWLDPSPCKDEPPQKIPRTTNWRQGKNRDHPEDDSPNDSPNEEQCNYEGVPNNGDHVELLNVSPSSISSHIEIEANRDEDDPDLSDSDNTQSGYSSQESRTDDDNTGSYLDNIAHYALQQIECTTRAKEPLITGESSSCSNDGQDSSEVDDSFDDALDRIIADSEAQRYAEVGVDSTVSSYTSGNESDSSTSTSEDEFPHPPSSPDEREEDTEEEIEESYDREENEDQRGGEEETMQEDEREDQHSRIEPIFYDAFNTLIEKLRTKLSDVIHQQPKISLGEFLLNALTLVTHFKMNFSQFEGVMKLVNTLFREKVAPDTRYRLDILFKSLSGMHYHFVCPKCMDYLGEFDHTIVKEAACKTCDKLVKISNLNECDFFVTFDLALQIELMLNNDELFQSLKNPVDLQNEEDYNGDLRDVYDGKCYQKFISSIPHGDICRHLSFCFSVDGAALYTSSNCQIWPIFCAILELPPYDRAHNLLLGGLWFGKGHAPLDIFFIPFAAECEKLSVHGFKINVKGESLFIKCHCLCCCADGPARAGVQCIHQHGGGYCCHWCLHPSEHRICDILNYTPEKRTEAQLKRDGAAVWAMDTRDASVRGVTGLSPLITVKSFDLVDGMILEYFHAAAHGIGKSLCAGWMGTDGGDEKTIPYYIGKPQNLKTLDALLKSIRLPVEARRSSREISEYKYWKGREFEIFILFVSVVILMNILPRQYLQHWCMFVQAIHFLLQEVVTQNNLAKASELLKKFGRMVKDLYPEWYLTYNMHIVCEHLAENCANWGPLWSVNGYCFEDGNRILKSQIHANNGISSQVCRALSHQQSLQVLRSHVGCAYTVKFQADIEKKEVKSCVYIHNDKYFGVGKKLETSPQERYLCYQKGIVLDTFLPADKVIHQGRVFTTCKPKKKSKTDNSVALLRNNDIVVIENIIVSEEITEGYIIGRIVKTAPAIVIPGVDPHDIFLKKILSIQKDSVVISISELLTICARVVVPHGDFVIKVPNIHNTS